jgi:hypothetical protein
MSGLYPLSAAIVVLIIVGYLYLRVAEWRGYPVKIGEIGGVIEFAMMRGYDGSRLRLRGHGRRQYIDFKKRIMRSRKTLYRLVLDKACCSATQFTAAQDALRRLGIDYRIVPASLTRRERVVVECGRDVTRATQAARAVLVSGCGFGFDDVVRATHKGAFHCWPDGRDVIGWDDKKDTQDEGDST